VGQNAVDSAVSSTVFKCGAVTRTENDHAGVTGGGLRENFDEGVSMNDVGLDEGVASCASFAGKREEFLDSR
jgi:hypothetical protein